MNSHSHNMFLGMTILPGWPLIYYLYQSLHHTASASIQARTPKESWAKIWDFHSRIRTHRKGSLVHPKYILRMYSVVAEATDEMRNQSLHQSSSHWRSLGMHMLQWTAESILFSATFSGILAGSNGTNTLEVCSKGPNMKKHGYNEGTVK